MEKLRNEIDEIDRKITELFEKRMDAVRAVAEYKVIHKLPVFNEAREKQVIEKNCGYLKNDEYRPYLEAFYHSLMDISKEYQKTLLNEKTT